MKTEEQTETAMAGSRDAMRLYGLGVLGLGEGRSILSAALSSPRWKLVTMCDLKEELCRQRCREFQLERYTLDYAEMLADPEIDAVAIYTPDVFHAEHIVQALEAGKHVICTKPLMTDLKGGRRLLDLVARTGLRLMVGQSTRFFEPFAVQAKAVEAGRHGDLLSIDVSYHGDKRQGTSGEWGRSGAVDWMFTGLTHPVDLLYWHAGPVETIAGFGSFSPAGRALGQKAPDMLHFVARTLSGVVSAVGGCYGAPEAPKAGGSLLTCTIRGSRGTTVAQYPELQYHTHFDGECDRTEDFRRSHASHYFRFGGYGHHAGEFQNYLDYFGGCLADGVEPRPNLRDGLEVIATLVAAKQSMETGQPRRVADVLGEAGLLAEVRPG